MASFRGQRRRCDRCPHRTDCHTASGLSSESWNPSWCTYYIHNIYDCRCVYITILCVLYIYMFHIFTSCVHSGFNQTFSGTGPLCSFPHHLCIWSVPFQFIPLGATATKRLLIRSSGKGSTELNGGPRTQTWLAQTYPKRKVGKCMGNTTKTTKKCFFPYNKCVCTCI